MVLLAVPGHKIRIENGFLDVRCKSGKKFRRHVKTVQRDAELFCKICRSALHYDPVLEAISEAAGLVVESFKGE